MRKPCQTSEAAIGTVAWKRTSKSWTKKDPSHLLNDAIKQGDIKGLGKGGSNLLRDGKPTDMIRPADPEPAGS